MPSVWESSPAWYASWERRRSRIDWRVWSRAPPADSTLTVSSSISGVQRSRQRSTMAHVLVEGLGEFVGAARMVEIVLPARLGGVGPGGCLNPRLPDHVAEPEDADAGHMADRGPDRPPLGRGPDAELVIAHPANEVDDVAVIHRPVGIERPDRLRAHAVKGNRLRRGPTAKDCHSSPSESANGKQAVSVRPCER